MLFRTRKSLRYLGELEYDITLMWIPSHMGIQGNERADDVLSREGSISGTLFQDQAGLTTANTFDIHTHGDNVVKVVPLVRNLGFVLNERLTATDHFRKVC
jgi:hypothetical protein